MENIKDEVDKARPLNFLEKIIVGYLEKMDVGYLTLTLPNGDVMEIGQGDGVRADLHIKNTEFFKKVAIYGDIGFGESYCDGDWESTDLTNLIEWTIQNIEKVGVMSGSSVKNLGLNLMGQFNKIAHFLNRNSEKKAKENISFHYDLSNTFYELMLDKSMAYSCGVFENKDDTLEKAQENKLQKIFDDLDVKDGDHILEIGCGWGSFAFFAAKKVNCRITGVTISKEQYKYSLQKVKELGLEDRVDILFQDYRTIEQKFDKVVSIEMIEAVGHEFFAEYFEKINESLRPNGVAVIQAITAPDSRFEAFKKGVDFIQKHIFPGSLLPSIRSITEACQNTELHIYNLRDIGLSYAKTLSCWEDNMNKFKQEIEKLGMDNTFFRKWKYYLNYCEAAFKQRNISTVQLTLIKPNNTDYKIGA